MTTEERKEELLNKIHQIDDSDLIQHLLQLIDAEIVHKKGEPYQLTEMERDAIQVAEGDVERNELLSEKEANEKIKKWL
jgi:DNA-binding HxlR family transcriptional regulator